MGKVHRLRGDQEYITTKMLLLFETAAGFAIFKVICSWDMKCELFIELDVIVSKLKPWWTASSMVNTEHKHALCSC